MRAVLGKTMHSYGACLKNCPVPSSAVIIIIIICTSGLEIIIIIIIIIIRAQWVWER